MPTLIDLHYIAQQIDSCKERLLSIAKQPNGYLADREMFGNCLAMVRLSAENYVCSFAAAFLTEPRLYEIAKSYEEKLESSVSVDLADIELCAKNLNGKLLNPLVNFESFVLSLSQAIVHKPQLKALGLREQQITVLQLECLNAMTAALTPNTAGTALIEAGQKIIEAIILLAILHLPKVRNKSLTSDDPRFTQAQELCRDIDLEDNPIESIKTVLKNAVDLELLGQSNYFTAKSAMVLA